MHPLGVYSPAGSRTFFAVRNSEPLKTRTAGSGLQTLGCVQVSKEIEISSFLSMSLVQRTQADRSEFLHIFSSAVG